MEAVGSDSRNEGLVRCLVKAPARLLAAAPQLTALADAMEGADVTAIRDGIKSIDLVACREHWSACEAAAKERYRRVDGTGHDPTPGRKLTVKDTARIEIGERDGWRCRYCSMPLVWRGFFTALFGVEGMDIGDAVNDLWRIFCQSPDHVVPATRGGENTVANLVSACGACNFSKMGELLEELGLEDPTAREPMCDGWAGLVGRPQLLRDGWSGVVAKPRLRSPR